MKRAILFFALLASVAVCKAQIVTIADESFEGSLSGWTITPANYWMADTNLYAGGHTSYHGFVPIGNPGDTVILTSPLYDFVFCPLEASNPVTPMTATNRYVKQII